MPNSRKADRRDAGPEGSTTCTNGAGPGRCRRGVIQDRSDARRDFCQKGGIQDRMGSRQEGYRRGGIVLELIHSCHLLYLKVLVFSLRCYLFARAQSLSFCLPAKRNVSGVFPLVPKRNFSFCFPDFTIVVYSSSYNSQFFASFSLRCYFPFQLHPQDRIECQERKKIREIEAQNRIIKIPKFHVEKDCWGQCCGAGAVKKGRLRLQLANYLLLYVSSATGLKKRNKQNFEQ